MTPTPTCYQEADVRLTGRGIWISRPALEAFLTMTTREDHLVRDMRATLAKLPEVHEPGGSRCACLAASA